MKKLFLFLLFLPVMILAQEFTPIANIQDSVNVYEGEIVTIHGLVSVGAGITNASQLNAFIQDNSGKGIMLFDYDVTSQYIEDISRGNELIVTGEVDEYSGTTEIIDFSYDVVSEGNPDPDAVTIDIGEASVEYEGTFVKGIGTIIDKYWAGGGTNLIIQDLEEDEITVRVWDTTGIDTDIYEAGMIIDVRGVGDIYSNELQIVPGYQDHLAEGEFDTYPYGDIGDIVPGENIYIDFYFPLDFIEVILFWKTASDYQYSDILMTPKENNEVIYETYLPGMKEGTTVNFYISALDTADVVHTYWENSDEEVPFSFQVPVSEHKAVLNLPAKVFNPYAGETFPIEFASEKDDKAILRIYNSEGKLVTTLQNLIISSVNGIVHYDWDGRDKNNELLDLGLYICYLEVIDVNTGKKKTAKAPIVIGAPLK